MDVQGRGVVGFHAGLRGVRLFVCGVGECLSGRYCMDGTMTDAVRGVTRSVPTHGTHF